MIPPTRRERPAPRHRYLAFYKPYGVLTSFTDPEGRPTLSAYIPVPGVWASGRLDQDSEGLLLLTDDGDLIHRLTHPGHKQPKTYLVQVEGVPDEAALKTLRTGVLVKGEMTGRADVELLSWEPELPPRAVPIRERRNIPTSWLRIILAQGRKRQIRHMTAAVGHPTLRLVRTRVGPISLGDLQPGQWRDLTVEEVTALRRATGLEEAPGRQPQTRPSHQPTGQPRPPARHPRPSTGAAEPAGPGRRSPGRSPRQPGHAQSGPAGRSPQARDGGPEQPPKSRPRRPQRGRRPSRPRS